MRVPKKYVPKNVTRKDIKKQKRNIIKSRKLYQKGIYYQRPKVSSFHSKPSKHVTLAEQIYKEVSPLKSV